MEALTEFLVGFALGMCGFALGAFIATCLDP
jgi:hypothetical protein